MERPICISESTTLYLRKRRVKSGHQSLEALRPQVSPLRCQTSFERTAYPRPRISSNLQHRLDLVLIFHQVFRQRGGL